jgi:diguanylate cyclase (GGDEF)-like protein
VKRQHHDVLPDLVLKIVAPLILGGSSVLTWIAARIFNRGRINPYPPLVAAGVWNAMTVLMGAGGHEQLASASGISVSGILYAGAAIEFWLHRGEELHGRRPMILLLGLEAIALFLYAGGAVSSAAPLPGIGWAGLVHFVGLFYAAGSAFCLVVMLKERTEAQLAAVALVDPLTGLANRRAFMDSAQRMLERSEREGSPISLLMFDLDRFKEVNDTFGHPIGDDVLRIFGSVVSRAMRPADIAGRIGGEEFAALLPGCGLQAGFAIAKRIRAAFEEEAGFVNGQRVGATVSVGVAAAAESARSLAEILASADQALYRAKSLGRNRVIPATSNFGDPDSTAVIRIA